MLVRAMSDDTSLVKARYCRSILKTATHCADLEARRLLDALATEPATSGASPTVEAAERAALSALRALADHSRGKSIAFGSGEWTRAQQSVENWIRAAS